MSVERVEVPMDPATFAEWQNDISDEGATARELKGIWKCGDRTVNARLQAAQKAGALKTGRRTITDIAGRTQRVPVYSFVTKPKRKGKVNGP